MILRKSIVLVGMMGSGKTAVGNALSKILAIEHVDSDEEIVKAANRSIAEIFERDGETFFRKRESEILNRILDVKPKIISIGGGAFSSPLNRKLISQKGMKTAMDVINPGVRQCDAVGEIQKSLFYGTEEFGGEYASIATLLPTGKGTSASHLTATQDKFVEGEATII